MRKTTRRNKREEDEEFDNVVEHHKQVNVLGYRINGKFKNKKQKDYHTKIINNRITLVRGSAGSGKTYVALIAALEMLKDGRIKKILITKPIVESANSMGFLPGDVGAKISNYMVSFYSNIEKLIGKGHCDELKRQRLIVEVPLNFMRGNTFGGHDQDGNPQGYFVIADEMQNATKKEMKLLISRIGEGTTMIIMGDSEQIDLKLRRDEKCGLDDAIYRLQNIPLIDSIEFTEDDIVRDPFLIEIMKRYNKD